MRIIVAVALAIGAVVLLAFGLPPAITALRARNAVVSSCDDSLPSVPVGTWVRLQGCGVDMFHTAFLNDAQGTRSHRVVPLRSPWGFAKDPSRIGLAIPAAAAADAFKTTPRKDASFSKTADLDETTGVVWTRLDALPNRLVEVPGFEHGLTSDAVLIEQRATPPLRRSAILVVLGVVALLLSIVRFFWQGRLVPSFEWEHRPVRWGLVLLVVLIGISALGRWFGWFIDTGRPVQTDAALLAPGASRAKGAPDVNLGLPPPTKEELALLDSPDPGNQLKAADTLLARTPTAELVTAVDAALLKHPTPEVETRLVCLKARFESPDTLEFVLARFPKDRKELNWNLKPEVQCLLRALADRADARSERVRDALLPAVYADNGSTRETALRAFRMMDLPQIPATLIADASTADGPYRRQALAAVLALGGIRRNPDVIAAALADSSARSSVVTELRSDPSPNAARIVANAWAERPGVAEFERLAGDRERETHDVSAGLLEIVLSPTEPENKRVAAARNLSRLPEMGPLHDLRQFAPTLQAGELKSAVEETIRALEARQKDSLPPQMRTLPR